LSRKKRAAPLESSMKTAARRRSVRRTSLQMSIRLTAAPAMTFTDASRLPMQQLQVPRNARKGERMRTRATPGISAARMGGELSSAPGVVLAAGTPSMLAAGSEATKVYRIDTVRAGPVTIAAGEVKVIITGFAAAEITVQSVAERARCPFAIAHPDLGETLGRAVCLIHERGS
jgi:hypothetical protein